MPGTPGARMPSALASPATTETPSSFVAPALETTSYISGRAAAGARGGNSIARSPPVGSLTTIRPEPARHVSPGSTTPATNPHATAASTALPPASSIATAASTLSRRAAATANSRARRGVAGHPLS